MAHIQAGAKKVVIAAPAGNDLKTIVYSCLLYTSLTASGYAASLPVCGQTVSGTALRLSLIHISPRTTANR